MGFGQIGAGCQEYIGSTLDLGFDKQGDSLGRVPAGWYSLIDGGVAITIHLDGYGDVVISDGWVHLAVEHQNEGSVLQGFFSAGTGPVGIVYSEYGPSGGYNLQRHGQVETNRSRRGSGAGDGNKTINYVHGLGLAVNLHGGIARPIGDSNAEVEGAGVAVVYV